LSAIKYGSCTVALAKKGINKASSNNDLIGFIGKRCLSVRLEK
jgi:hypothetical protein